MDSSLPTSSQPSTPPTASHHKSIVSIRQSQEGGVLRQQEERDMMRALSEMPPGGLNHFDPTFVLLEGGMGAAVNTSMSRRHAAYAMAREADISNAGPADAQPSETTPDSGNFALPGLAAALSDRRSKTAKMMSRAVGRIMADKKIQAAQEATADFMDHLAGGQETHGQQNSDEASFDIQDEEELQEWAREWLKKPSESQGTSSLSARIGHRLRCWHAARAPPELLPVAIVPQTARSTSRQPFFGKLNPRPTSSQLGPPAVLPSLSNTGFSESREDPFTTPERSTDTFLRPMQSRGNLSTASSLMGSRRDNSGMDSFSSRGFEPHGIFREASKPPGSPAAAQPLLRFASFFKEPHRGSKGVSLSGTPEFQYLRCCELAGLIPCSKAMQQFGSEGIIDASWRSLQDADVAAIIQTAVACASQGYALHGINLSGNKLTDHGLQEVATCLEKCSKQGEAAIGATSRPILEQQAGLQLSSLSFAGNTSIHFKLAGLSESLERALSSLPGLMLLDFSLVPLQGSPAIRLASCLTSCCPGLQCLALAGCGLGLRDQSDCCAVAGLLAKKASFQGLQSADFSGNHFGRAAFTRAGTALRKSRLKHISFAGNVSPKLEPYPHQMEADREAEEQMLSPRTTAGQPDAPMVNVWSTPDGKKLRISPPAPGAVQMQQAAKEAQSHQPIATRPLPIENFLELLQANTSLEELDISNCNIGPDTAWVLSEAVSDHGRLEVLGVADNPLGELGMRHIVNMLVQMGDNFRRCDLNGSRNAETSETIIKFRLWQPEGSYRLLLRHPHERATLRALLKIADKRHPDVPGSYLKFDQKPPPHMDRDPQTGLWNVPTTGVCNVTYAPPLSPASFYRLNDYEVAMRKALEEEGVPTQILGAVTAAAMEAALSRNKVTFSLARACRVAAAQSNSNSAQKPSQKRKSVEGTQNTTEAPSSPLQRLVSGAPRGTSHALGASAPPQYESEGSFELPQLRVPPGLPGTPEGDGHEAQDYLLRCRLTVAPLQFQIVRQIFRSLLSAERDRFVIAIAKDLWLTAAQVQALLDDDKENCIRNAQYLFPSIVGRKPQLIMLKAVKRSNVETVAAAIRSALWFQEGNPTGSYNLDLSQPVDYFLAESCLLLSAWESESSRYAGRPDVSQHGNGEMIRNEAYNEAPFIMYRDWILPSHGWLRFDYSSVKRPPPGTVSLVDVTEVVRHLRNKANKTQMKLQALRAVSVHIFLSTNHARALISSFQNSDESSLPEKTLKEESVARQEAFCILHTRVFDRFRLLGPELLYSPNATMMITESIFLKNQKNLMAKKKKAHSRTRLNPSMRSKTVYTHPLEGAQTPEPPEKTGGEGLKTRRKVLPSSVQKALTTEFSKKPQTHGALRHRDAMLIRNNELKLLDREDKVTSSSTYSVLMIFSATDQLALMRRLGVLHLTNPLKPDVHRLPINLSVYELHRAVQFLAHLGSAEPSSGSYGRVICWCEGHQVSLPASWADRGVPMSDMEFIASFDDSHGQVIPAIRQALADEYFVGFTGGAGWKN